MPDARIAGNLCAVEYGTPAQERRDRPVRQFDAGIWAPANHVMAACRGVVAVRLARHHDNVCITADIERALAMTDAKQPRWICR